MASAMFNKGKTAILDGSIDLLTSVIRVMLMKSTYSPNVDHDYVSDVSADEIYTSGTNGYTRQTCASKTVTEDDTNNRAAFDCADQAFGSISTGATIGGVLYYVQVGGDDTTPANDVLICYTELSAAVPTNGAAVTNQVNASGVFYLG